MSTIFNLTSSCLDTLFIELLIRDQVTNTLYPDMYPAVRDRVALCVNRPAFIAALDAACQHDMLPTLFADFERAQTAMSQLFSGTLRPTEGDNKIRAEFHRAHHAYTLYYQRLHAINQLKALVAPPLTQ